MAQSTGRDKVLFTLLSPSGNTHAHTHTSAYIEVLHCIIAVSAAAVAVAIRQLQGLSARLIFTFLLPSDKIRGKKDCQQGAQGSRRLIQQEVGHCFCIFSLDKLTFIRKTEATMTGFAFSREPLNETKGCKSANVVKPCKKKHSSVRFSTTYIIGMCEDK